jgi:putative transposase
VIEGVNIRGRAYQACLERSEIQSSCHGKEDARDNAAMESFFGTVKDECVGEIIYSSHDEARLALFTYIEVYYNRVRRHSTLGTSRPRELRTDGKPTNVTLRLT